MYLKSSLYEIVALKYNPGEKRIEVELSCMFMVIKFVINDYKIS